MSHTKIGELNGGWGVLFKLSQLLIPIFALTAVPWCIWVNSTFSSMEIRLVKLEAFANLGPRFTKENADALRLSVMNDSERNFQAGNQRVLDRLDLLALAIAELKLELTRHVSSTEKKP